MTTNKPEVFEVYRTRQGTLESVVLLADYEALQAELARELQRRFDGNEQASREYRADVKALVEALEEARHHVVISPDIVRGGFIQEIDAYLAAHRKGGE